MVTRLLVATLLLASTAAAPPTALADPTFRIERIASGLSQPSYVTQAPGDPANILYFTERTSNTIAGFGAANKMGKVWRYDVNTRLQTLVLDLSNRVVINDDGLQTIAFNPDFNTPGSPGYQKMYVSLAEAGTTALNKVEEYTVPAVGTATLDRVILQYSNNTQNNHTVDWIGFDPTATGEARNFLYISTGDGSFGNSYSQGLSTGGRPSQNPADLRGKILRVDVDPLHADAYPADSTKNFAIPATNPIAAYNAANPTSPLEIDVPGLRSPLIPLPEVFVTGVRNGYRASFDRATGDLYFGDVGEFFLEEVDVLKAGTNPFGYPVDFGWPQREGTFDSGVPGAPDATTNPFTGVASLEPLQQFPHIGGGNAVIGGYMYRGPIAELRGKYFYSDFVGNGKIWMLDFDRNTDPANYNGDNGLLTEVTELWQSLVVDPTDPAYLPEATAFSSAGLDHIVSFGEDNAGNLYLVDFGNGFGFNGQYPGAGLGEIFRLTPIIPEPNTIALAALALLPLALGRLRFRIRTTPVCVFHPPTTLRGLVALPVTALIVALLHTALLNADDLSTTASLSLAEVEYLTLGKEFRDQLDKFWEQNAAITDPRAAKDFHTQHDPAIEYLPKFLAFEREHSGQDVGLDALSEVASYAARGGSNDSPAYKSRREMLARLSVYEDRLPMARVLHRLAMGTYDSQVIDYLRRLSESPQANPTVRATAQLELSQALLYHHAHQKNSSEKLQDLAEGMPTRFAGEAEFYQESLANLPPADQLAAGRDQAISLLESLAAAGDSLREPVYRPLDPNWLLVRIDPEKTKTSTSLAAKAVALLFKQRHLRPGQPAPDLELQLIDGKHWSLAEQHGRLVVVQFCFTGCGPCEEMYPQLRKLHERLGDQLSLITILRDDTPEHGVTDAKTGKITWPIACDGVPGTTCTRWAVNGFPTVYLIDASGNIAAYGLRGDQLEWKVDKLLANKKQ